METTVCVYAGSSCPLPVYTRSYPNRAFIILTWYWEEETYPDSVTTGAWPSEFSFRISMVFWQDTECVMVRGADRCRLWTVRFHHLQDGKTEVLTPTCPVIPPLRGISYSWFADFCCFFTRVLGPFERPSRGSLSHTSTDPSGTLTCGKIRVSLKKCAKVQPGFHLKHIWL